MSCPKCDSDDWKLASVVYNEGFTNVRTSSIGVASNGGVGVAGTSGKHQTESSRLAAPPTAPSNSVNGCSGCLGLFLIVMTPASMIAVLQNITAFPTALFFGFCAYLYIKIMSEKNKEYSENSDNWNIAFQKWQNQKVCQRCGTIH